MKKALDFLTPNTISFVILLNEYSETSKEFDPSTKFASYLT